MKLLNFFLNKPKAMITLMIIILLANLIVGKIKWQYYSFYGVIITLISLLILRKLGWLNLNDNKAKWIIGINIVFLLLPLVLNWAFPTEEIPTPSGEYNIGTKIYELKDDSRNEIYGSNQSKKRKIKYQVFYPADDVHGYKKDKWMSDGKPLSRYLAKNMNILPFMLDHTLEIESNSYLNAAVSSKEDSFPIVIISHGWKGFRELHVDYAEELASNGIIAVTIDHTYGSRVVKFSDDSVVYYDKEALPRFTLPEEFDKLGSILATTFSEDINAVMADLENINREDDNLKDKINLDNLGLLGHSTGGGGSVYTTLNNGKSIKAIMGLDAWVEPYREKDLDDGLKMPSLFLRSEQWKEGPNNGSLTTLLENSTNTNLVQLYDTKHVDFSMSYMYSPLTKYIGLTGSLENRQSSKIQREYILAFFEKYLNNDESISDNFVNEIADKYQAAEVVK